MVYKFFCEKYSKAMINFVGWWKYLSNWKISKKEAVVDQK